MTPSVRERPTPRLRAESFTTKPIDFIVARTFSRVVSETRCGRLRTLETVAWDTPATLATS